MKRIQTMQSNMCQNKTPLKTINQMTAVSVVGNIGLSVFKLFAGIIGHSSAMISDAIHSISDIATSIVAYIGVKASRKPADKTHPYGHERFECVASLILTFILCFVGIKLGSQAINNLIAGNYNQEPGVITIITACVSILTKEVMFWYTKQNAEKIQSSAFKADAWHHRTDALSSVGALIGITCSRIGLRWGDAVASLVIAVMIACIGIKIFITTISQMTDSACAEELEHNIHNLIVAELTEYPIDRLTTRKFGEKIYVDLEISLPGNMTVTESHSIIEKLHDKIETQYIDVKHIMIHVNPLQSQKGQ